MLHWVLACFVPRGSIEYTIELACHVPVQVTHSFTGIHWQSAARSQSFYSNLSPEGSERGSSYYTKGISVWYPQYKLIVFEVRERQRRKWWHHCQLKLVKSALLLFPKNRSLCPALMAVNSHVPLPKISPSSVRLSPLQSIVRQLIKEPTIDRMYGCSVFPIKKRKDISEYQNYWK